MYIAIASADQGYLHERLILEYIRIGAFEPPVDGRSAWARESLSQAMAANVAPAMVPSENITFFTAGLPPDLIDWLKRTAAEHRLDPALAAAGLIQTVQAKPNDTDHQSSEVDALISSVRSVLRPMVLETQKAISRNQIVFCEAATGTGKGRMLLALGLQAISEGQQVVVSAPITIIWQLVEELRELPGSDTVSMTVMLGRPNFVSPEALYEWATETGSQPILDWIVAGARPHSAAAISLGDQIGVELSWLLEEAMALADDIPAGRVILSSDGQPTDGCPAEAVYRRLRSEAGRASLLFCSHHLLAYHCLQKKNKATALVLPMHIGLLLVDEAHLLEQAFASIFSQSLHLHSLKRVIRQAAGTNKQAAIDAVAELEAYIQDKAIPKLGHSIVGQLKDFSGLQEIANKAIASIGSMKVKKSDAVSIRALWRAMATMQAAQSGMTSVRLEQTPVKKFVVITAGQANLQRPFKVLWDSVGAAALVSATLYTDGINAGLLRWKLALPKDRTHYLPPIVPSWVTAPVTLMKARVGIVPDESAIWHSALADQILDISEQAKGGTLVLATAYATLEALESLLSPALGNRLLIHSPGLSATAGAAKFKSHGYRPVWLAVGAAWTGIDLSDKSLSADQAHQDNLLTDLVICRLPFGVNRSLTHHRRMEIAGRGVNVQEALWVFRQGIGRLVRRDGIRERKLWLLDCRIDSNNSWIAGFRNLLKQYRQE